MTEEDVKYGKDGKPTSESLERAFKENIDLFHKLQDKHMTTKGTMGDNVFKDILQKIMGKTKGEKK